MECMFPGARNLTEYWRSLVRGEDGITDVPPTHWAAADYFDPDPKRPDHTYCTRGGFLAPIAFDPTEFGIPPTILEATDTAQLLSLCVAKAALEDAGYGGDREFNRERVSVVLGITGTQELVIPLAARLGHPLWRKALREAGVSESVAERVIERISDGYVSWQENSFPGLLGNVVAGRIANRLNLRGTNCVIDAACASSLGAVHLAMMELATGRADMVVSGGADTLNDIFMYMCFSKTPALSPTGDARPFSADSDGTVLGEGIGILVLKRLEDAERDGDRIYAVIRGIGTSSDGRSQSIYAPHSAGQARCLRNAYRLAGIEPDTVTLIEAHGTGTKVGDATEFEALKTVFREARTDGSWCAIGSVKSQIGHTKAAAGAAGLIKAALAIHHRALPPTLKIREPNPKLGVEESPFYLNTEARPWIAPGDVPRRAGVSSFGFGGSNFHAVLEEHRAARPEPSWDGSVQLIALSAATAGGLLDLIDQWHAKASDASFDRTQLAYWAMKSREQFSTEHGHRLVLVVELTDDPIALLRQAKDRLLEMPAPQPFSARGIEYGCGSVRGKLAIVLPGQGSQYVGMLRRLACVFPAFHETLSRANAGIDGIEGRVSEAIYPAPAFQEEAKRRQAAALTRTEIAQPALGAMCLGAYKVLELFGVTPDALCGHSYGELVALCAGGYFDDDTLFRLTRLRGRLMAGDGEDRGAMLAVKAPLAEIDRMVAEDQLEVVVANRNGPAQGVLSGRRQAILSASERCKARGFACTPLAVSGAFHSALMESAVTPFRNAVDAAEFRTGRLPVYANATAGQYPRDAAGAKALLARQLSSPVNFVGQILSMYDAGVRTFVEAGPKMVLTGLIGAILADRPHLALAVDASAGRRCGIADLARVLARLAADGASVNLRNWERPVAEPRKPRMAVPLTGANYRAKTPGRLESAPEPVPLGVPVAEVAPTLDNVCITEVENPKMDQCSYMKFAQGLYGAEMEHLADRAAPEAGAGTGGLTTQSPEQRGAAQQPAMTEALRLIQEGLRSMQALQQQTAAAHQRFLETQEQAHRAFQQLLESQQRLVLRSVDGASYDAAAVLQATSSLPPSAPAPAPRPAPALPGTTRVDGPAAGISAPLPVARWPETMAAAALAPTSAATVAVNANVLASDTPGASRERLESAVLEIVGEKTGYPREMIALEMDIEADLGIDSIKRVEIVAAIEERVPGLPSLKPEHMGSLRTLGQIVDYLVGPSGAATPRRAPATILVSGDAPGGMGSLPSVADTRHGAGGAPAGDFSATLLSVVAELTGYPREMLNLDMDIEADLGIDSIKRVEILAGVEARVPNLPPVKPEYMGSLRTLRQIVTHYGGRAGGAEEAKEVAATAAPFRAVDSQVTPRETTAEPGVPSSEAVRAVQKSASAVSRRRTGIHRGVVRVKRLTDVAGATLTALPAGDIWVAGPRTNFSDALAAYLRQRGLSVRGVGVAEVATIRRDARAAGLIIVAPERVGSLSEGRQFLADSLMAAKALGGDLASSAAAGSALFATVTRMDGMFGHSRGDFDPIPAGLSGLAKAAACEWLHVKCRTVDIDSAWTSAGEAAREAVEAIFGDGPMEIGLRADGRYGLEVATEVAGVGAPTLAAGDVVVVTGGARGVTAESALALARRYAPTLVLLGRTEVPEDEPAWLATLHTEADIKQAILKHEFAGQRPTPAQLQARFAERIAAREIRQNLRRIREAGGMPSYFAVDVRDAEAVARVLRAAR
ncbi:MAG: polyketide-type polyunsaturated fatty acid synthase PfaA, partial [Planctomycetota bacterium]